MLNGTYDPRIPNLGMQSSQYDTNDLPQAAKDLFEKAYHAQFNALQKQPPPSIHQPSPLMFGVAALLNAMDRRNQPGGAMLGAYLQGSQQRYQTDLQSQQQEQQRQLATGQLYGQRAEQLWQQQQYRREMQRQRKQDADAEAERRRGEEEKKQAKARQDAADILQRMNDADPEEIEKMAATYNDLMAASGAASRSLTLGMIRDKVREAKLRKARGEVGDLWPKALAHTDNRATAERIAALLETNPLAFYSLGIDPMQVRHFLRWYGLPMKQLPIHSAPPSQPISPRANTRDHLRIAKGGHMLHENLGGGPYDAGY